MSTIALTTAAQSLSLVAGNTYLFSNPGPPKAYISPVNSTSKGSCYQSLGIGAGGTFTLVAPSGGTVYVFAESDTPTLTYTLVEPDPVFVSSGQSIQDAIDAAVSGTTIFIGPGTYHESLMLKDGVHLHFELGAIVHYIGSTGKPVLYDAYYNGTTSVGNTTAITCFVTGFGRFIQNNSASSPASDNAVISSYLADSVIVVECLSVLNSKGDGANLSALLSYNGLLRANVKHSIVSENYDGLLTLGASGVIDVVCPYVSGGDDGIETDDGTCYLTCNQLVGANSGVNATGGNTYLSALKVTGALIEDGGNIFATTATAVP